MSESKGRNGHDARRAAARALTVVRKMMELYKDHDAECSVCIHVPCLMQSVGVDYVTYTTDKNTLGKIQDSNVACFTNDDYVSLQMFHKSKDGIKLLARMMELKHADPLQDTEIGTKNETNEKRKARSAVHHDEKTKSRRVSNRNMVQDPIPVPAEVLPSTAFAVGMQHSRFK